MRKPRLLRLLCLLGSGCVLASLGCARKTTVAASPARVQQNQETARQFLTTLQGMPPGQRPAYVQAHPEEARVAVQSEDPAIRTQLQLAMTER